jgi:hypothetical protein
MSSNIFVRSSSLMLATASRSARRAAVAFFAVSVESRIDHSSLRFFDLEFGADLFETEQHGTIDTECHATATWATITEATEATEAATTSLTVTTATLLGRLATFSFVLSLSTGY